MRNLFFTTTLVLLLFISCQSSEPVITDGMTTEDYFQRAQEAAERNNYELALNYYIKFKEAFPDNVEKNIWATYEMAIMHHKLGRDTRALELLNEVIVFYESAEAKKYTQAPRSLAERVKANIEKSLNISGS